MKRIATALAALAASPAFAHVDGTIHAHPTDHAALLVGLSALTAIGAGALVLKRVRK